MILSSLHPLAVISVSVNEAKLAFFLTGMARSLKKLNWLTTQLYRDILIYIESMIFKLLSKLTQILCIMKWSYQGSIHMVWMRHYWHFIYGINLKYLNLVKAQHQWQILICLESTILKLLSKLKHILRIMRWSYQGCLHFVWMRQNGHFPLQVYTEIWSF